jgi:hypothetical protein
MPAINYCLYKTNIWCIPTTEIATWWQVVIAAVAVYFAIRAIKATNATSQAVLERDKSILDAKRAAFLIPLTNELYAVLVRSHQIKDLNESDNSKQASEHILNVLAWLEIPCVERCIGIIEAFTKDEAIHLTKCSLTISKAHNFVKGNPVEKLEDPASRKLVMSSFPLVAQDLKKVFSEALAVMAKASGLGTTVAAAANQATRSPLLVPRESLVSSQPDVTPTPPSKNPPDGPSPAGNQARPSKGTAAPKPAAAPSTAAAAAPAPSVPPSDAPTHSSSPEARKPD